MQETIAVIKQSKKEMFSNGSITWLNTFSNVQHALNGGEINICGKKVDGFNKETNTVYQYHGCFWHGCPKCYNEDTINNKNHETMGDLYEKTKERNKQITDAGFTLIEMW
jgi:G:T-mismatch repair DNA endonuclease (very short patch repair protein)